MTGDQGVDPAVGQRLAREYAEAARLAEAAVAAARATHGDSHPQVAFALSALAELHQQHSELAKAEATLSEALAIRELNPADASALVDTLRAVARLHEMSGHGSQAGPLMQRAARIEAEAFQTGVPPVESVEPESDAHADFIEDMAGSAPKTFWTQALGGIVLPAGLTLRGIAICASGRVAIYGRGWVGGPLIVEGTTARMIGLVWICGAAFAHFHFFWPYRNRPLCSYGKAVALVGGSILLMAALAKMWMG